MIRRFTAIAFLLAATAAAEPPHVELDPPAAVTVVPLPLDPPTAPPEGVYGGWGQGAIGPDGRFYVAIGNHLTDGDADAWLFAYDPQTGGVETVFSTRDAAGGWEPGTLGDGKLHTGIDISPDGEVYLPSFYGNYPLKGDVTSGRYPGGRLFRADVRTGEAESLGVPVPGESWPMGRWDHRRGKLVAVGESGLYQHPDLADDATPSGTQWEGEGGRHSHGQVLLYDTEQRRVEHGGFVPGMKWERRSLTLDPDTGRFFGSTPGRPSTLLLLDPSRPPAERIERTTLGTDSPILRRDPPPLRRWRADPRQPPRHALRPGPRRAFAPRDRPRVDRRRLAHGPVAQPGRPLGVLRRRLDLDRPELRRPGGPLRPRHRRADRPVPAGPDPLPAARLRRRGGVYTAVVSADGRRLFVQLNGDDTDIPEEAQVQAARSSSTSRCPRWSRWRPLIRRTRSAAQRGFSTASNASSPPPSRRRAPRRRRGGEGAAGGVEGGRVAATASATAAGGKIGSASPASETNMHRPRAARSLTRNQVARSGTKLQTQWCIAAIEPDHAAR